MDVSSRRFKSYPAAGEPFLGHTLRDATTIMFTMVSYSSSLSGHHELLEYKRSEVEISPLCW